MEAHYAVCWQPSIGGGDVERESCAQVKPQAGLRRLGRKTQPQNTKDWITISGLNAFRNLNTQDKELHPNPEIALHLTLQNSPSTLSMFSSAQPITGRKSTHVLGVLSQILTTATFPESHSQIGTLTSRHKLFRV